MKDAHYSNEDVLSTLEQILSHEIFASSSRAIGFLKYVIIETLENRANEITGTTIAQDVFGKGAEFDGIQDSTVRVYARRLRSMLLNYYSENPAHDPVIITIPKGGYKPLIEKNLAYYSLKKPTPDPLPSKFWGLLRLNQVVGAILILFAGLLFAIFILDKLSAPQTSTATLESRYNPIANYPRIAVATFENNTGIEDYDFLESALQKSLVEDLSRFSLIRPSSYEGRYEALLANPDSPHDYVISGMILSVKPSLDLYIKLVSLEDSKVLFKQRVQRANENSDYFDSLSKIVSDLSGNFAGLEGVIVKRRLNDIQQTINQDTLIISNLQAFECYALMGVLLENPNPEIYRRIYSCLETSLKEDPNNSTLLSAFGWVTYIGATSYEPVLMARSVNPDINADEGAVMMQRAVDIDPNSADALQNLSAYKSMSGDIQGALKHAETAVILNPGNPDNLTWLSRCLISVGQWDRALIFAQEALDRNHDASSEYYHPFFYAALHTSDPKAMQDAADKIAALNDYYAVIFSYLAAIATKDESQIAALQPDIDVIAARNGDNIMTVVKALMQSEALSEKARDLLTAHHTATPKDIPVQR